MAWAFSQSEPTIALSLALCAAPPVPLWVSQGAPQTTHPGNTRCTPQGFSCGPETPHAARPTDSPSGPSVISPKEGGRFKARHPSPPLQTRPPCQTSTAGSPELMGGNQASGR